MRPGEARDREELDQAIAALRDRFPTPQAVPRPRSLAGLRLAPATIECWHGSPDDRLHERWRYRRVEGGWSVEVLVP